MSILIIPRRCLLSSCLILFLACSQQRQDREIKADITIKAKEDLNFAGVRFVVDSGVVYLTGTCPTEKSRAMVRQKLQTIHLIDRVDDQLTIGAVTIGATLSMQQDLDSVLAKYPSVTSVLSDSGVILIGKIKPSELEKLLPSLKKVHPVLNIDQLQTRMY